MILVGCSPGMLRADLIRRGLKLAKRDGLLYEMSCGASASLIFGVDDAGRHGNFAADAYSAIIADPAWRSRLTKVHTASKRERVRANWRWRELDCANSSDALLMNIFCHPDVTNDEGIRSEVASLLGVGAATRPSFGVRPGVPLKNGRVDQTEVDMQIGDLFVEAKLTESGFQQATLRKLESYRDFNLVFDVSRLPWSREGAVKGYQLIRNVLSAYEKGLSFCVIVDGRRPNLIETWYSVMSAVRPPGFSWRLKLLTWQELVEVLPDDLTQFINEKYGFATPVK